MPPPNRTISGSIVCISVTAPDGQVVGCLAHQALGERVARRRGRAIARLVSSCGSIERSRLGCTVASSASPARFTSAVADAYASRWPSRHRKLHRRPFSASR